MNESAENIKELSRLVDEHRPHEALLTFLEEISGKSFSQLSTYEMVMLDLICQRALPEMLEHKTIWMVNHPSQIRRMLELLTGALPVGYHPAAIVDHIAWLRCLLAIEEARAGRVERVHEELCLVRGVSDSTHVRKPNGTLRRQIQSIGLAERSASRFLELFFEAYTEFLKRIGQYEMASHLENRIGRLLGLIARDEKRPGVVQALFYDKIHATGHADFVHVKTERHSDNNGKSVPDVPIGYVHEHRDVIDAAMRDAAVHTQQTVDAYLKRIGLPDGLDERFVHWEIGTVQGDAVKLERRFQGGSIALPLAVAIISQYLAKPVPNDVAFTGALNIGSVENGRILPVDGVPEKVRHATTSGCKVVYIPVTNLAEFDARPALQNLINEHSTRVVGAETLDQVCKNLFPPEGSGRLKDTIKDAAAGFVQILYPANRTHENTAVQSTLQRHRTHIIVCSLLMAGLVFLEGWRVYKVFPADYPALLAWMKILAATAIIFAGMCFSFALPAACLRHQKNWSWYAAAGVLAAGLAAVIIIVGSMLPDSTGVSSIYNAPPMASLIKDLFVIWVFAWAIAANTFNAVAALESLIAKRQFVTTRTCLHGIRRWKPGCLFAAFIFPGTGV